MSATIQNGIRLNTIRNRVLAAIALLFTIASAPALAAQEVFGGSTAQAIINQIRATGGARYIVGSVTDSAGNVEAVMYRDVVSLDGTARDHDGQLAVVVTFGPERRLDRTPLYAYPIYYYNPNTNAWVLHSTAGDRAQAEQTINWIRGTYRLQTYCQPAIAGYQFNWPGAMRAGLQTAATAPPPVVSVPARTGGATTPTGPGLLGVPMGGH